MQAEQREREERQAGMGQEQEQEQAVVQWHQQPTEQQQQQQEQQQQEAQQQDRADVSALLGTPADIYAALYGGSSSRGEGGLAAVHAPVPQQGGSGPGSSASHTSSTTTPALNQQQQLDKQQLSIPSPSCSDDSGVSVLLGTPADVYAALYQQGGGRGAEWAGKGRAACVEGEGSAAGVGCDGGGSNSEEDELGAYMGTPADIFAALYEGREGSNSGRGSSGRGAGSSSAPAATTPAPPTRMPSSNGLPPRQSHDAGAAAAGPTQQQQQQQQLKQWGVVSGEELQQALLAEQRLLSPHVSAVSCVGVGARSWVKAAGGAAPA